MGGLIKKYGGSVSVLGPIGVPRTGDDFEEHKTNIVAAFNDCSKMLTDRGLTAGLHQDTGTCIETRDEVYVVLDAVDVNTGIPVPVSLFSFSGHKKSFFSDLLAMGQAGVRFFTQVKSVTTTWFDEEEMKPEEIDTWDGVLNR